ncbi:MAG TPA: hypothetical protein VHT92_03700 [Candidatus Cybelea sp.]|jgi:hypothetical protein|nr:hypothetical protein [Candidatus Cybelea sp.]
MRSGRLSLFLLAALILPLPVQGTVPSTSRVYVKAIPCSSDSHGQQANITGPPEVTLYDQAVPGNGGQTVRPRLNVTKFAVDTVSFYFDIAPGLYDAFFRFAASTKMVGGNGPLIVISGRDRHLVVAACNNVVDWHARAAIAGLLPVPNVTVSVLVFKHPMRCGDDYNALDQKTLQPMFMSKTWDAVIDDGAYYANFYGWGKQDRNLALRFSGALFTEGAILVNSAPDTRCDQLPFLRKDITQDIVNTAMRG